MDLKKKKKKSCADVDCMYCVYSMIFFNQKTVKIILYGNRFYQIIYTVYMILPPGFYSREIKTTI